MGTIFFFLLFTAMVVLTIAAQRWLFNRPDERYDSESEWKHYHQWYD